MNADGTPAVAADVEVGAKTGALTPVAVTLLIVGGVALVGSVVLIVVGARGRRVSPGPDDAPLGDGPGRTDPEPGAPLDPPSADTAIQFDDDARTPAAVG